MSLLPPRGWIISHKVKPLRSLGIDVHAESVTPAITLMIELPPEKEVSSQASALGAAALDQTELLLGVELDSSATVL